MAERRMFSKQITDSDAFMDMPHSTQNLYFHFGMQADDDGFLNNSKKIMRMLGASDDDMKILLAKNFIIPFDSGVCVIKHWKVHNYIPKDRYKPTVYHEEAKKLSLKDNNVYTMNTTCIQDVSDLDTQVRLGKGRLGESREEKPPATAKRLPTDWKPSEDDIEFCRKERPDLNVDFVADSFRDYWISKSGKDATKRDWSATWRNWVRREAKQPNEPQEPDWKKGML